MMLVVAKKRKKAVTRSSVRPPRLSTGLLGGRLIPPAILAALPAPWPSEVDCDDLAMLMGSMLLASGIPCQFVTISTDPRDPMRLNHVYVQAVLEDGTKFPMDPQGPKPGWEPRWIRRKEWPVMLPPARPQGNDSEPEKP